MRSTYTFLLLAFPALAEGTEKKEAAPPGFDPAAMEEAWNQARTSPMPKPWSAAVWARP